jgi:hypothetical protein
VAVVPCAESNTLPSNELQNKAGISAQPGGAVDCGQPPDFTHSLLSSIEKSNAHNNLGRCQNEGSALRGLARILSYE